MTLNTENADSIGKVILDKMKKEIETIYDEMPALINAIVELLIVICYAYSKGMISKEEARGIWTGGKDEFISRVQKLMGDLVMRCEEILRELLKEKYRTRQEDFLEYV